MIPPQDLERVRTRVRNLLQQIDAAYRQNQGRPVAYRLTPDALQLFHDWYLAREGSIFERRLDTYAHRLMLLLATSSGKHCIDADLVRRVIALLQYQLDVRRECDPVDADNVVASMEEKIRRALSRGSVKGRELKRKVHYNRTGIWVWNTAIENLKRAKEVAHDRKLDQFWLCHAD